MKDLERYLTSKFKPENKIDVVAWLLLNVFGCKFCKTCRDKSCNIKDGEFCTDNIANYIREAVKEEEQRIIIIPKLSDDDIQKAIKILKNQRPQIIADDKPEAWISVDERLPDKSDWYLVNIIDHFGLDKVTLTNYTKTFGWNVANVTHWMPLPEPPKKKGGAE